MHFSFDVDDEVALVLFNGGERAVERFEIDTEVKWKWATAAASCHPRLQRNGVGIWTGRVLAMAKANTTLWRKKGIEQVTPYGWITNHSLQYSIVCKSIIK